jgi:ketosteroid isomerase-like protein
MTELASSQATRDAVLEHLASFNSHDAERVLIGLTETVVWATGKDVLRGRAELVDVFDDGLWDLEPRLDLHTLIVEGDVAAARCTETIVLSGETVQFPIAVFFQVRSGLLSDVKVFREGSAALPSVDR